jgi:fatty-acyl-CoA synthase
MNRERLIMDRVRIRVEGAIFERLSLPTVTEHFPKSGPAVTGAGRPHMSIRATHPYESGLDKNAANYVPLTPISFLCAALRCTRAGSPSPMESGATTVEVLERRRRLAAALTARRIGHGGMASVMAPNIPEKFEPHFGVPMAGAVLNALNIRLDPATIAFVLQHGETKVLITDSELAP